MPNRRYDFAIYNESNPTEIVRLIEFDGEQHFQKKEKHSWDINGKYEQRIFNDEKKNNYALTHNINLIRIPYWERDNITLFTFEYLEISFPIAAVCCPFE